MPNGPSVEISNFEDLEDLTLRSTLTGPITLVPARRMVSVGFVAAAAGDYAAADVISNNVTDTFGVALPVGTVVSTAGEVAILDAIVARCSEDSVLFRLRLHFYNTNPLPADVEMDDNIAADWAKTATGRNAYLGSVTLPAMADMGTAMAMAQADNLRKLLGTKTASSGLWFVVETLDAEANETALMRLDFDLYFLN